MCFIKFEMSWNWPSSSRECLLYWLCWHLVVETSSLTVKRPMCAWQYFQLWMWRHIGTLHWSCWSAPTEYGNSHASGWRIQKTRITGHWSQHKMNEQFRNMSQKYWGHPDIETCGCRRGIHAHCNTFSQCTITCSIIWMAWCKLWLRRGTQWKED